MSVLERKLYGLILRMHPAAFRNEFGREMALDFEDARKSHGLMTLYWDAVVSLARQWVTNGFSVQAERGTLPKPSLLTGQYVMICQDEMTPMEFVRGLMLSVTFLTLCAFAESHVTKTGAMLLSLNHMGPSSPQQGNSSAVGSNDSDDVRATGAGGRSRQSTDKVPMDRVRVDDSAKETVSRTGERADGSADSKGKVSLLAAAVSPKMNARSNDGQAGAAPMTCDNSNVIPAYGNILHACGPLPSFEVVSIRPWKPAPSPPPPPRADGSVPKRERFAPGRERPPTTPRVRMILPTELLITSAYGLPFGFEKRILNRPDWLGADQYEIQAKIEDSLFAAMQKMTTDQQRAQVSLMEQSLLADRFKLKVHFETREVPVYALVVAKGGAKLTPAKEGGPISLSIIDVDQGLQMKAVGVTLDQWITSPFMGGRIVEDQTGLKGRYDFTLTFGQEQPAALDGGQGGDAPTLTEAIQEQLGLKLVPTKGQVEVIVIDHIERPSVN